MWPQHAEQYFPDGQPVVVQSAGGGGGGGGGGSALHVPGTSGTTPAKSHE